MKINKTLLFAIILGVLLFGLLSNLPFNLKTITKSCEYNGKTYQSGEGFKDIDGCNSCSCDNGNIACTLMACETNTIPEENPIDSNKLNKSCEYNGIIYKSGEGFKDIDGCNSCSCDNGNIACTLMACEED